MNDTDRALLGTGLESWHNDKFGVRFTIGLGDLVAPGQIGGPYTEYEATNIASQWRGAEVVPWLVAQDAIRATIVTAPNRDEYVSEAWEAVLKRADAPSIRYRMGYVADAETCNQLGIRSYPTANGTMHEVFVVRPDGTELKPFDRCLVTS